MRSIYIPKNVVDDTLATPPVVGKRLLPSFRALLAPLGLPPGVQGPIEILENHEVEKFENQTEIHKTAADLWIGISGAVTFVTGGEVVEPRERAGADGSVNPNEIRGEGIRNGIEHVVGPGDILYIPPGDPHTHFGTGRLFIIKIPVTVPA